MILLRAAVSALCVCAVVLPGPGSAALADPPHGRADRARAAVTVTVAPKPRPATARRCTADGASCIRIASYAADVCRAIEATSRGAAIDPHFFARLVWRESLFAADAVSPAGAQGIAQFMPETARIRGLKDPFNPAEALRASADYLADLARGYGNIGLAAVAYNGGEARADRFVARQGGLPLETRAYVYAITGHSAETWRDAPPGSVDLTLAPDTSFAEACVALAGTRRMREFRDEPPLAPWGVVVASNRTRDGVERQAVRLRNRHATVIGGETFAYTRTRRPGMPARMHMAQLGRTSRADADALCGRLRASGADCMVLKN